MQETRPMSGAHHNKQPSAGYVAKLTLGALGVVYGDIGTSPLYALRESFHGDGLAETAANVEGVLCIIFWSLILIITGKYLTFVMKADHDGEGGILALTGLTNPGSTNRIAPALSRGRWLLLLAGLFGTAVLYGDGMITPAISVLSAVEGFEVASSAFEPYVIPLACAILVALFSVQRWGTAKVGAVFGPVMVVWFAVLAILGVVNIVDEPSVLGAINPAFGVRLFLNDPWNAFVAMGSIFLVVTGGEALYADMGHFGRKPIQIGWFALAFPALMLNYFGQGALVITDPENIEAPFYNLAPDWALIPLVILATMATIIASQALISGAFSLTLQAIQLGYSPRTKVVHTSADERGQIYIPTVNWALMVACVGLVIAFRSSTNLAAAYGIAVTLTMVITTVLFSVVARETFGWSKAKATTLCGVFLAIESVFLAANVLKIPRGGWFPLVVGALVFTILTTWFKGRQLVAARMNQGRLGLDTLIRQLEKTPVPRNPGTAVYLYSTPGLAPPALLTNLKHNNSLHERVLVVAVRTSQRAHEHNVTRVKEQELGNGFCQVEMNYGFLEEPNVAVDLDRDLGFDLRDATFFLGRETVLASDRPGMAQWRERLFALLSRNATNAARFFHLPPEKVIEVGVQVDI
jgi:KUP system potassium uptake protein